MSRPGLSPDTPLGLEDIRRRAEGGALLLGARGAAIFVLALGGNLVLAKLLVPKDFGLVALGTVLLVAGTYLSNGGIGAALIGKQAPPGRVELEAVLGFQLAASGGLAALFAAATLPFGRAGAVLAVMVASLPVYAFRVPASIVLERELSYRPIATVDVVDAVSYYVWAIATVAAGLGVWGLATAVLARAVAGTILMLSLVPDAPTRPRWSWPAVRPLLGFGLRFQGISAATIVRDQGLNVGVAAIGGISTLGVWSFAYRVLRIPYLLFSSLWRVAYPAMARLLEAEEDPRPILERGIGIIAVAAGVMLVGVVGSSPALIPAVIGERWHDVPGVMAWAGIGVILSAPIGVTTAGYLMAAGAASIVLRNTIFQTVAWFAVGLALLPPLGVEAVGLGWVAAGLVSTVELGRQAARRTGAVIVPNLIRPVAVALAAGALAWWISSSGPETVWTAALGGLAGEALLLAGLMAISRDALKGAYDVGARAVRAPMAP